MQTQTYRNAAADHAATTPRRVSVLPPDLANQIAAGEVVERPASVVKELVENSLDAGARSVEVTIETGGRDLIRVEDDGCGMEREDALRALERHATSKLTSVDDLFAIMTLGFRGEAMPSIGSVSRLSIRTKPHGALSGTRVIVAGGLVQSVEDVGMAAGTTIEVEDLFFNTPARLKFLKTPVTEARHITEMLVRMSLSRPDVRFVLRSDGKVKLDLPEVEDVKERILATLGREVYDVMYPTYEYPAVNGVVARGYFSKPGHKQRTPNKIYTFVNGRYVSDTTVRAAIKNAYSTLMEKGRYPSIVLFLDVPASVVDVNVHPSKTEVRFHDTNSIFRAVYHAIADALAEAPWIERDARVYALKPGVPHATLPDDMPGASDGRHVSPAMASFEPLNARHSRQSFADEASPLNQAAFERRRYVAPGFTPAAEPTQQGFSAPGTQPLQEPPRAPLSPAASVDHLSPGAPALPGMAPGAGQGDATAQAAQQGQGADAYFSSLRIIGQFKRMYMLCEDASGLVIIDQHAAHERIGFERLKAIFEENHKESQPLLFPARLELDTLRAEVMHEHLEFFGQVAFEIEHFGGNTFVLKSMPAIFKNAKAERLVRDILDDLSHHGRTNRLDEAMEAILSRMACHSVVRGPTPLTEEEMRALLVQMDSIDFKGNCPHGRPVYWRLPLMELEASFDRR